MKNELNMENMIKVVINNILQNPEARNEMKEAIETVESLKVNQTKGVTIPFEYENNYTLNNAECEDILDSNVVNPLNEMKEVLNSAIVDEHITVLINDTEKHYDFEIIPIGKVNYEIYDDQVRSDIQWKGWGVKIIIDDGYLLTSINSISTDEDINSILQNIPQRANMLAQIVLSEKYPEDEISVEPFNDNVSMAIICPSNDELIQMIFTILQKYDTQVAKWMIDTWLKDNELNTPLISALESLLSTYTQ